MAKQKDYDLFMVNVREMMYSEQGTPFILQQIQATEQGPIRGIAYTAAMIIKSIKGGFEMKGKKVSPDVLKTAFMETVADLIDLSISAGFIQESQKKEAAQQALAQGAEIYKKAPKQQSQQTQQMQQPQQTQGLVQTQMEAA